jgi:hypothetical protein
MMTVIYGSMQTNSKFVVRSSYGKSSCNTLDECMTVIKDTTLVKNIKTETYNPTKSEEVIRVIDDDHNEIIATISLDKSKKTACCHDCEKIVPKRIHGKCPECYDKYLKIKKEKEAKKYKEDVKRYTTIGCTTGVCNELKSHHAALANDEERLRTPFLLEMICGKEIRDNYIAHKKVQTNQNI